MEDLIIEIQKEDRISKLKLLTIKMNDYLPASKKITGYTTYNLGTIELLRNRVLNVVNEFKKETKVPAKVPQEVKVPARVAERVPQRVVERVNWDMTVAELRKYAIQNNISLTGVSLKADIIKRINQKVSSRSSQVVQHVVQPRPVVAQRIKHKVDESMTVVELRKYAIDNGISLTGLKHKSDIIQKINSTHRVLHVVGVSDNVPPRVEHVQRIVKKDIADMQKELEQHDLALLRKLADFWYQIKIPSGMKKPEVISLLLEKTRELSGHTCNTQTSPLKLKTTPYQDFMAYKFDTISGDSINKCLMNYNVTKDNKGGKGSFGVTFIDKYKGQTAIYKVVRLDEDNFELFKWECVLTERASKLGVGATVLGKALCKDKKELLFGVLILSQCSPILYGHFYTKSEFEKIHNLINILHENGIAHRDLSTRNIMYNGNSFALIDYGFALGFNGKVPEEYRVWDHAFLSNEVPAYEEYLSTIKSKDYMKRVEFLAGNGIELEKLTVKVFPEEMIKTLGIGKNKEYRAKLYLNNSGSIIITRMFDDKVKKLNL